MLRSARLLAAAWTAVLGLSAVSSGASAAPACPNAGFTVVEPAASSQTRPVRTADHRTIYVDRSLITTTADITEIKFAAGDDEDALILIKFTPEAATRLQTATAGHSGMRVAFVSDDEVLLAVTWQGPYGMDTDGSQLSIPHGTARARAFVAAVQACKAAGGG